MLFFIDELIRKIQISGLCCSVYGIKSTPPGYANDIATACYSNSDNLKDNIHKSPTYDKLLTAIRFGVFNQICEICDSRRIPPAKKVWSTYIWSRAWKLDELYWE